MLNLARIFIVFSLISVISPIKLPDYLKLTKCNVNDENYSKCKYNNSLKILDHANDHGIRELNLTRLDPFLLTYAKVSRDLNEMIKIHAEVKNMKVVGSRNMIIETFTIDPKKLTGHVKMFFPKSTVEMEYDVKGQLFIIPLQSKGFFSGNFTNSVIEVRGTLTEYERDGEKYLKVQKLTVQSRIGDGYIRLISKNPEYQFGADLIANFYNANPRFVMDAINPIFESVAEDVYKEILRPILEKIPTEDLLV